MRVERALELVAEHGRLIAAQLAEGRRLLGLTEASHGKALALVRWQLMRSLREYQLFKETEVFGPLSGAGDARAKLAARMAAQGVELATAYEAHATRWSLSGLASWETYQVEARVLAGRIEALLASDAVGFPTLLSGVARTRELRGGG